MTTFSDLINSKKFVGDMLLGWENMSLWQNKPYLAGIAEFLQILEYF